MEVNFNLLKFAFVLDDNLRNCTSVEKENIKVWLFDNDFNKYDNHFDRVYNWEDVYNRIVDK